MRFVDSNYDAVEGADALAIVTDWNEYRHPDFARVRQALRRPVLVDGRNLYDPAKMAELGFLYDSVGRPIAAPGRSPRRDARRLKIIDITCAF